MKIKNVVVLCVAVLYPFFLGADGFIIPKKKNSASAALKEECCQEMAEVFKRMPLNAKLSAELQEEILKNFVHLMEGNKKNILQGADTEKLKKLIQKFQYLQKNMEESQQLLQECLDTFKEIAVV